MSAIIRRGLPVTKEVVERTEAQRRIEARRESFKLEILDGIPPDSAISLYHIGDVQTTSVVGGSRSWWDLCAGPHLQNTKELNSEAIELDYISGVYWKGKESNPQLQRIHGLAWETPQQLAAYKLSVEEAKRRDHRLLGQQMNLFSIQTDEAGGGLVFWRT